MIKFQQSQALTSHFESFWNIVQKNTNFVFVLVKIHVFRTIFEISGLWGDVQFLRTIIKRLNVGGVPTSDLKVFLLPELQLLFDIELWSFDLQTAQKYFRMHLSGLLDLPKTEREPLTIFYTTKRQHYKLLSGR